MVDKLLARGSALDLIALVQIFEQLCSSGLGHAILEVGTDVCGAVGAVLLAQVIEDQGGGLLGGELCLFFFLLSGRHVARVGWASGCVRPVIEIDSRDEY
jgi:hypothetical protein